MEHKVEEKKKKKFNQQQHKNKSSSDLAFKPSSEVKGLRFGAQFIVKSFTVRRATSLQLLRLLSLPQRRRNNNNNNNSIFPSTTAYVPTNFTILAHHAWHTLTLGLGTKKSKVILFVFESEAMKVSVDQAWPEEIPLGEVNKRLIRRGLSGCEMARFKFRKGCLTFYVYAVRCSRRHDQHQTLGSSRFERVDDLTTVLQSVVALKDFLDHTAMLALPHQRRITTTNTAFVAAAAAGATTTVINVKKLDAAAAAATTTDVAAAAAPPPP
ncbi:hypothetical protein Syun_015897 [Stephania yunnanensis]|uniref:DUF7851 domain-containing protein n=1 Tax=Stephania yunnanensis TaxID=152371 RepID=A0AAP0J4X1_9MAGN